MPRAAMVTVSTSEMNSYVRSPAPTNGYCRLRRRFRINYTYDYSSPKAISVGPQELLRVPVKPYLLVRYAFVRLDADVRNVNPVL